MSLLSQVKRGKISQPILTLVYGPDGIGKSTFAAAAPKCIFLGPENGTANLDVARFPSPKTFRDVLAAIDELTTGEHAFESLAIDSLDWLEHMVWDQVCFDHNWKSIEQPGYGKGYVEALKLWREMRNKLSLLRERRGLNIILIAHHIVKKVQDPQAQAEYDKYQLKLNDKAAGLWREYVDSVLFANYEIFTKSEKGKTKAFGEGDRALFTEGRPGFDAKNRFSLPARIPFDRPFDWAGFEALCNSGPSESAEQMLENIKELMEMVSPEIKTAVDETLKIAGSNPTELARIQEKLRTVAGVN